MSACHPEKMRLQRARPREQMVLGHHLAGPRALHPSPTTPKSRRSHKPQRIHPNHYNCFCLARPSISHPVTLFCFGLVSAAAYLTPYSLIAKINKNNSAHADYHNSWITNAWSQYWSKLWHAAIGQVPTSAVSGLKSEVKLRLVKDCLQFTLVLTCCLKTTTVLLQWKWFQFIWARALILLMHKQLFAHSKVNKRFGFFGR